MKNLVTIQSVRVRMSDYKRFYFLKEGLNVHQKINLRNNILVASKPIDSKLLLKN